jgi:hypothetical protein
MSHHTNLAMQILSKLVIVGKIEDVLQSLYAYFFHSPKRTQEFVELANIWKLGDNTFSGTLKLDGFLCCSQQRKC